MLLVECSVLDKIQVINEGTGSNKKLKIRGRFQKCDEQNNNGRIYPRKVLESQVKEIQDKIRERSLVGALDHPPNDAIHLSQASHLITNLRVDKSGDVIGEAEILSTPNGKIVEALLNDGVKIGISSRGLGSVTETGTGNGSIVNEDFKLVTFDLVSDPSTKGAFPELTESIRENSQRAQEIISKHKKTKVFLTLLESKIEEACSAKKSKKSKSVVTLHDDDDGDSSVVETDKMGFGDKPQPTSWADEKTKDASAKMDSKAAVKRAAAKLKTFRKDGVAQSGTQQDLPFKEGKEKLFTRFSEIVREKLK